MNGLSPRRTLLTDDRGTHCVFVCVRTIEWLSHHQRRRRRRPRGRSDEVGKQKVIHKIRAPLSTTTPLLSSQRSRARQLRGAVLRSCSVLVVVVIIAEFLVFVNQPIRQGQKTRKQPTNAINCHIVLLFCWSYLQCLSCSFYSS